MSYDITPVKKEAEEILYQFQEVKDVVNQDEYNQSADIIKAINFKVKKLEDKRKEWTKPILDSKKKIDDDFKSITKPLEELVKKIKSKMIVFAQAEQKRIAEEQAKAEKEAMEKLEETGELETEIEVVEAQKTTRGEISTATVKENWQFEVEDYTKVPMEYLQVDEQAIRQAIKDGVRQIDGVKIYDAGSITIR